MPSKNETKMIKTFYFSRHVIISLKTDERVYRVRFSNQSGVSSEYDYMVSYVHGNGPRR